jgi:dolichol-phosphate mannosyltransferase
MMLTDTHGTQPGLPESRETRLRTGQSVSGQLASATKLSVIIPAYNEANNLSETLDGIIATLRRESIQFEIVIVNDNSYDKTRQLVLNRMQKDREIVLINNTPPGGFGRAIRAGLCHFSGDAVAIMMADHSDDPEDLVRCYRKLLEGYDCVFGSRFRAGSTVTSYPRVKLAVNRVVNKLLQLLFMTPYNDLTNAFKLYQRSAIEGIGSLQACHFNITIELSLSCVIRGYSIAEIPINWYGRTWGVSKLKLGQMGRKYLATLLKIWFERLLIADDIIVETVRGRARIGEGEKIGSAPP